MAVSVFSAAKYLAVESGWSLTNLQIQKILYLAQMAYMAEHGGRLLVNSYFQAWEYGPVCPPLYHKLKIYGGDSVGNIFHPYDMPEKGDLEEKALAEAYDKLGGLSGGRLSTLTQRQGGAWEKYWQRGMGYGSTIPNEDILQEYKDMKKEK